MKTVNKIRLAFLFIILSGLTYSLSAQKNVSKRNNQTIEFEEVKSKGGFNVSSGIKLDKSITIEDQDFSLYTTSKGSVYIKCLSPRTGNNYPVWIGKKTELPLHDGYQVYQMKSGTYCIYKISSTGNPYPVYLRQKKQQI